MKSPSRKLLAERAGLVVALIGLLAVLGWLLAISRENAERAAEAQATRVTQVEQCFGQATEAPATHEVLSALESLIRNQIEHIPLNRREFDQTQGALEALQSFHERVRQTAPTLAECKVLADRLDVERQQ